MRDEKYNGWTNYATWRVRLECFDGAELETYLSEDPNDEDFDRDEAVRTVAESMKEELEYLIEEETRADNFARGFALAFISDVNWREIAEHLIDDAT